MPATCGRDTWQSPQASVVSFGRWQASAAVAGPLFGSRFSRIGIEPFASDVDERPTALEATGSHFRPVFFPRPPPFPLPSFAG